MLEVMMAAPVLQRFILRVRWMQRPRHRASLVVQLAWRAHLSRARMLAAVRAWEPPDRDWSDPLGLASLGILEQRMEAAQMVQAAARRAIVRLAVGELLPDSGDKVAGRRCVFSPCFAHV